MLGVTATTLCPQTNRNKIYCVYNAPSEGLIREHAERTGFPANKITPVSAVINPTTAR